MRCTLHLRADAPSDGVLLLEIVIALGAYRLRPEILNWSLIGTHQVKLMIVLRFEHEPHVGELTARFRAIHGVTEVQVDPVSASAADPRLSDGG